MINLNFSKHNSLKNNQSCTTIIDFREKSGNEYIDKIYNYGIAKDSNDKQYIVRGGVKLNTQRDISSLKDVVISEPIVANKSNLFYYILKTFPKFGAYGIIKIQSKIEGEETIKEEMNSEIYLNSTFTEKR